MSTISSPYLIIGGSTKCGTTSLFSYFQFHPQVCPCIMKESRYFLEGDYSVLATRRDHDQLSSFSELFNSCQQHQTKLEATPDYLYSAHALHRISGELTHVKMIFILRDPIDRLMSWYRFSALNGMIPADTNFDAFVEMQDLTNSNQTPQHLRALYQGRYSGYLKNFIHEMGSGNIHICFYEELRSNPAKLCRDICSFAGLDPSYFDQYEFRIFNKSVSVKSVRMHRLFRKFKRSVRPATRLLPTLFRQKVKLAGHSLENAYALANQTSVVPEPVADVKTMKFLREFYSEELQQITLLSGVVPSWENLKVK